MNAPIVGVDVRCLRAGVDGLAGVGTVTREILRRLTSRSDLPVRLLFFEGSRWRSKASSALGDNAATQVCGSWLPGRVLEWAWARSSVPSLEAILGRVDLLHGPDYFLPPHRCERRVFTVHDLAVLRRPEFSSDEFRRSFERQLPQWQRKGARFIAVSRFTRREMMNLLSIPSDRIDVVPNGVDVGFFAEPTETEIATFRARWGLPERFVLGVGSIQPRKNLVCLLRAFRLLRDPGDLGLVLCGNEEWLSGSIRAEAAALGSAVRFVSLPRASMPLLYRAALALAYPSWYEGFGLPLLEAMAAGTPVCASRVASHPEVVGEAGLLFDPASHEELAAALERLIDDASVRARLAAAGQARAREFTWDCAAQGTLETYERALAT